MSPHHRADARCMADAARPVAGACFAGTRLADRSVQKQGGACDRAAVSQGLGGKLAEQAAVFRGEAPKLQKALSVGDVGDPGERTVTINFENEAYSMPLGLGIGQVIKRGKTVFNLFVEPQASASYRGPGQPDWQIFAGFNMQFLE